MKYHYILFMISICNIVSAQNNDFEVGISGGVEKLLSFPHQININDKFYDKAYDIFRSNGEFGLMLYKKYSDKIRYGFAYSILSERLNKAIIPDSYKSSGIIVVNKFGLSAEIGKTFSNKYFMYFI